MSATATAPPKSEHERARELADLPSDELEELAAGEDELDAKLAKELLDGRAGADPTKQRAEPEPQQMELEIEGAHTLEEAPSMGGKRPTRSTMKFTGGKVRVVGVFEKGERVRFEGTAIVNQTAQKDEHDAQTGQVVECEQRHEARIVDLQLVSVS